MKSLFLNGRMALMRKTACLLTLLFAAVATVFLLLYPRFIENTRAELEYAYDSIPVTGWLFNGRGFQDPNIESELWHTLLDTESIGTHYTYSNAQMRLYDASFFQGQLAAAEQATAAFARVENALIAKKDKQGSAWKVMKALNVPEAYEGLARLEEEIQWMEGWSAECLNGREQVCLVADNLGYQLGDWVPIRLKNPDIKTDVFCFRAVGLYPYPSGVGDVELFLPIGTLEDLCLAQGEEWPFWVNGFSFLVDDNRALPLLKDRILEMGLDEGSVRAAIDDRILDGTVAPIKSNLAMLEGLYKFFFVVVAAIGFFLCFLLARGRKQEYAVMRLLGESAFQVTCKALLEQLVLCLLGIVLGAMILFLAGQGAPELAACGIILACYTLGAAIAVVLTVRVNVMEILRDKE